MTNIYYKIYHIPSGKFLFDEKNIFKGKNLIFSTNHRAKRYLNRFFPLAPAYPIKLVDYTDLYSALIISSNKIDYYSEFPTVIREEFEIVEIYENI